MDGIDYWRFCDELTVVQAALLIVDEDPSQMSQYVDGWRPEERPKGYVAVLNALQLAIIGGRLDAVKVFLNLDYQHPDAEHPVNSIDWHATRVNVETLKLWLSNKGSAPQFFFPDAPVSAEYLDPHNPNFSPKMAAAVEAWRAVRAERAEKTSGRSVKSDLVKWLNLHAPKYGLTNEEGEPNKQAIEEVAKVANWDQKGGAPRTPGN
jgi:hypothetical protein